MTHPAITAALTPARPGRLEKIAHPPVRTTAALLVECLPADGCAYVFSVPGEETLVDVPIDYRENLRLTERLGALSHTG